MTDKSANIGGILEKVRALLAKAASTTSEDEAASCCSLANKLLEKYNLSMADIKPEEQEGSGEERMNVMYTDPWRSAVVRGACNLYFCNFFHAQWFDQAAYAEALKTWEKEDSAYRRKHGKKWWEYAGDVAWEYHKITKSKPRVSSYMRPSFAIVGRPHNRAVCIEMVNYLWDTTRRLSREYSKVRREKLAFQRGCGERLASRLNMMAWEAQKKAPKQPGTALTIYDDFSAENKAYMDSLDLVKRKAGSSNLDSDHADAGAKAGDKVSLAPQVGATGPSAGRALPAPSRALPAPQRASKGA